MSEEIDRPSENNHQLYKVSEAAEKLGVTSKTLKNWEKRGDIPAAKRNYKEDRVYTDADIENIREIKGLDDIRDPSAPDSNP